MKMIKIKIPRTQKLKNLFAIMALGSAFFVLSPQRASAGNSTVTPYAADDLILGFRQTSGQGTTEDYMVDLGQVSQLNGGLGLTQSFTIPDTVATTGYGNVAQDLKTIFGSGWYTDGTVLFSLEAAVNGTPTTGALETSDPAQTLYTTVPAGDSGNTNFTRQPTGTQSGAAGNILNMGGAYTGSTSTANSDLGVEQTVAPASTDSYGSYQPGGGNASNESFAYWSPSNEGAVTPASGTDALEFERLQTGTTANGFRGTPGQDLGTFSLDSSGDLIFNAATAVPEPSVWASMVSGLGILLVLQRRGRLSRV